MTRELAEAIVERRYDFVDYGCSSGASLKFGLDVLGGVNGFGIDLSPEKVRQAKEAGYSAFVADATSLFLPKRSVRFATLVHFLEHLPSAALAEKCIRSACSVARDFVFIRQPWFDSDGHLFTKGFKLYWSDWTGHTNQMTTLQMFKALRGHEAVREFRIYGRRRIHGSSAPEVHPVASAVDQPAWDPEKHPPKPAVTFDFAVYHELGCLAVMKGSSTAITELEARIGSMDRLI